MFFKSCLALVFFLTFANITESDNFFRFVSILLEFFVKIILISVRLGYTTASFQQLVGLNLKFLAFLCLIQTKFSFQVFHELFLMKGCGTLQDLRQSVSLLSQRSKHSP